VEKIRLFISSVQREFANERLGLYDYLVKDPLLSRFFDPFIFENLPAADQRSDEAYLSRIAGCDLYLGIFGAEYGSEDEKGISPAEHEYNEATRLHKTRLIFITPHLSADRHHKMQALIKKVEKEIVRKCFTSEAELKACVYASLIKYLEEKEIIRTSPFDVSICTEASLADIDPDKIKGFLGLARAKRNLPLPADASLETVLTHLNLIRGEKVSNAALLLFGKHPQRFFLTSEIKCAHFHGKEIVKPIPAYQVYKGDVFQLVDQAVDFVLSKIDVSVGTREISNQVPVNYELPRAAVAEAIVNAVVHRDYTSNESVQVMLFKDRLEIWNPGTLPLGLNTQKLRHPHSSIPANPLLAEPMYLAGYIERLGTGTGDIIRLCEEKGLNSPDFIQEENFKTILWRSLLSDKEAITKPVKKISGEATGEAGGEASGEASPEISRLLLVLKGEAKRADLQNKLGLKSDDYFRVNYINPSLESGYIEMTIPDNPRHQDQRYRLTPKGRILKTKLQKRKKKT